MLTCAPESAVDTKSTSTCWLSSKLSTHSSVTSHSSGGLCLAYTFVSTYIVIWSSGSLGTSVWRLSDHSSYPNLVIFCCFFIWVKCIFETLFTCEHLWLSSKHTLKSLTDLPSILFFYSQKYLSHVFFCRNFGNVLSSCIDNICYWKQDSSTFLDQNLCSFHGLKSHNICTNPAHPWAATCRRCSPCGLAMPHPLTVLIDFFPVSLASKNVIVASNAISFTFDITSCFVSSSLSPFTIVIKIHWSTTDTLTPHVQVTDRSQTAARPLNLAANCRTPSSFSCTADIKATVLMVLLCLSTANFWISSSKFSSEMVSTASPNDLHTCLRNA